jgi:hypothetical protein
VDSEQPTHPPHPSPEETRDPADPRNLIRERSRLEPEDPPNLRRLTTRQTIEESGVVETQERLRGGGASCDQPVRSAAPDRATKRR